MILGQPFIENGPVEPLNVGVLLWLPRLDIFERDAPSTRPFDDRCAQIFRAVVATYRQRPATPADDLLERTDHAFGWQREVHRPHLVEARRHRQRLGRQPHQPLTRLDPQIQLKLAVDPVHALVIPSVASDIAQVQKHSPKPQLR